MKNLLILILLVFLAGCKEKSAKENSQKDQLTVDLSSIGALLDSINNEDQKYRIELDQIEKEFGWQSEEVNAQWSKISKVDEGNLEIIEEILAEHGWLSSEQVGSTANSTLFLVIQHSNQEVQEKYLPMMRKAVKEGNANSSSLALLEDRIGLGKGELQVYGSQIGKDQETGNMYVLPLFEPEKVNERRASVGLGTIEEYLSNWDLEWDLAEYKKNLPKWLEKLKAKKR